MFSFTSFPRQQYSPDGVHERTRHHQDVEDDVLMDIDEGDDENGLRGRLTLPGETLTSAQDFMRFDTSLSEISLRRFD